MTSRDQLEQWLWGLLQRFQADQGDGGKIEKVVIDHPDGDAVAAADEDNRFVTVWVRNIFNDKARALGRLFSPGGMLWWLPEASEVALSLRPADLGGSLVSWILHGIGGADSRVPSWLSATRQGLYARAGKYLRLDAEDKDVELTAGNGKVLMQGGGRKAAGKGHSVDIGSWSVTIAAGAVASISVIPPGGGAPIVLSVTPTPLSAQVSDGSSKVEIDS